MAVVRTICGQALASDSRGFPPGSEGGERSQAVRGSLQVESRGVGRGNEARAQMELRGLPPEVRGRPWGFKEWLAPLCAVFNQTQAIGTERCLVVGTGDCGPGLLESVPSSGTMCAHGQITCPVLCLSFPLCIVGIMVPICLTGEL